MVKIKTLKNTIYSVSLIFISQLLSSEILDHKPKKRGSMSLFRRIRVFYNNLFTILNEFINERIKPALRWGWLYVADGGGSKVARFVCPSDFAYLIGFWIKLLEINDNQICANMLPIRMKLYFFPSIQSGSSRKESKKN